MPMMAEILAEGSKPKGSAHRGWEKTMYIDDVIAGSDRLGQARNNVRRVRNILLKIFEADYLTEAYDSKVFKSTSLIFKETEYQISIRFWFERRPIAKPNQRDPSISKCRLTITGGDKNLEITSEKDKVPHNEALLIEAAMSRLLELLHAEEEVFRIALGLLVDACPQAQDGVS